ncbi:hypothetical protein ACWEIJ_35520 [Lentzea sp. NPDC004789]
MTTVWVSQKSSATGRRFTLPRKPYTATLCTRSVVLTCRRARLLMHSRHLVAGRGGPHDLLEPHGGSHAAEDPGLDRGGRTVVVLVHGRDQRAARHLYRTAVDQVADLFRGQPRRP